MNKREERKLKGGFFMMGGLLLASRLHSQWELGWILSLILGFIFIIAVWLGIVWAIKKTFGK